MMREYFVKYQVETKVRGLGTGTEDKIMLWDSKTKLVVVLENDLFKDAWTVLMLACHSGKTRILDITPLR